MTTAGGGWTIITLNIAQNMLDGKMVAVAQAPVEGFDSEFRPYTRDTDGEHTYHYTFQFPAGFQEFYLHDYLIRANAGPNHTSDIQPNQFVQTLWSQAFRSGGVGDVSFGSPDQTGPITSYARELSKNTECHDCTIAWPAANRVFKLSQPSNAFRIGWGESGPQSEGWYPWWNGTIQLR
jgi:hypothetical protein